MEELIDPGEESVNQQQTVVSQKVARKKLRHWRNNMGADFSMVGRIYDYFKTRFDNNFIQLSA